MKLTLEKEETLELLKDETVFGGICKALDYARKLADRSASCARRSIGCVILGINGRRLFEMGLGYNGTPSSMENCKHHKTCPDAETPAGHGAFGRVRCFGMHAEHRAILDAWYRSSLYGGYGPKNIWACVCTKAPCTLCTSMLMETGCKVIIYDTEPNDNDAALFFHGVRMSFNQLRDHFNGVS